MWGWADLGEWLDGASGGASGTWAQAGGDTFWGCVWWGCCWVPPAPVGPQSCVTSGCWFWALGTGQGHYLRKKRNWKLSSNCQKDLADVTGVTVTTSRRSATHARAVGGAGRRLCWKLLFFFAFFFGEIFIWVGKDD